jgi:hypothetical protein
MKMRLISMFIFGLLIASCGVTGVNGFTVDAQGEGPELPYRFPANTVKRGYQVSGTGSSATDGVSAGFVDGETVLPNGRTVGREVAGKVVTYIEYTANQQLYWGSSEAEKWDAQPIVQLDLPLKKGKRWSSTDSDGNTYSYQVEGLERVSVAAGEFDTIRVTQSSKSQKGLVTRWYSNSIGMVLRLGEGDLAVRTTLVWLSGLEKP